MGLQRTKHTMTTWGPSWSKPTSHCRYCGIKLTQSGEFNSCFKCKNKELNDTQTKTFIIEGEQQ